MKKPSRPRTVSSADLHIHTTHSDGSCSPGDVVRAAANVGLSALAITDHDTLSAIPIARPEAERLGIELIPGIEVTAEYQGVEIHLLGHYVRPDDPDLLAAVANLRTGRVDRLLRMVEHLARHGFSVDLACLQRAFPKAALGRKHLADWLTRTGQIECRREVFSRYLGDSQLVDIPKPRLPWADAIALIRSAGGVAGWAHPPYDLRESTLRELQQGGLQAIEVVGPGAVRRLVERRQAWADRLGLVPLGGSDFHSADRPGRWVGSVTAPQGSLGRLRATAYQPAGI